MKLANYKIFVTALAVTIILIIAKYLLHIFHFEAIALGSLHSSAISGIIFVIGFILSATIADYKEAERIPAEISSTIENMYDDILSIHAVYPKFKKDSYVRQLKKTTAALAGDLRNSRSHEARNELAALNRLHVDLEEAGVPANYIVKLKQQTASLARFLSRVNYIQRISFMPSATILAWAIVVLGAGLLAFTEVEPFVGGMVLTGVITFIMVYVLLLIRVISIPFHDEGRTKDDVSLFLLERTLERFDYEEKK